MEGKKIGFIVVAIATVGGIAYYLNKKNKAIVLTNENLAKQDYLTKQDKAKQDFDKGKQIDITAGRVTVQTVQPRGAYSAIKPSTGFFKPTE